MGVTKCKRDWRSETQSNITKEKRPQSIKHDMFTILTFTWNNCFFSALQKFLPPPQNHLLLPSGDSNNSNDFCFNTNDSEVSMTLRMTSETLNLGLPVSRMKLKELLWWVAKCFQVPSTRSSCPGFNCPWKTTTLMLPTGALWGKIHMELMGRQILF